jgi:hypothetical protein
MHKFTPLRANEGIRTPVIAFAELHLNHSTTLAFILFLSQEPVIDPMITIIPPNRPAS